MSAAGPHVDGTAPPATSAADSARAAADSAPTAAALRGAPAEPPPESPPAQPFSAARFESQLWLAQRMSALVLAVCVVVHLATIMLAVRGGLSADEILTRLRTSPASPAWLAFYLVFVASVAVHAPLGLRAIVAEWLGWRGRFLNAGTFLAGTVLLALGLRAIAGLFGGPG